MVAKRSANMININKNNDLRKEFKTKLKNLEWFDKELNGGVK